MDYPEKHKKSKDKKHKKHKKHKNKKRSGRSNSDNDSCASEEWVETGSAKSSVSKREDWMDMSDLVPTFSNAELKWKKEKVSKPEERQLRSLDKPGQHERELNPYWRDGGKGLPSECPDTKPASARAVGDGGLDWLTRAYRRVMEQAKEEGKTPEEVAAPRWGSLEKLESLLRDAQENAGDRGRRRQEYKNQRYRCSESSQSSRTFQKPRQEESDNYGYSNQHRSQSNRPRWQKLDQDKGSLPLAEDRLRHTSPPETQINRKISTREEHRGSVDSSRNVESDWDITITKPSDKTHSPTLKETSPKPALTMSKQEMNELGAKIMKAELIGNTELAKKLKARLEAATEVTSSEGNPTGTRKEEVVVLTQTNSRGLVAPLTCPGTSGDGSGPRGNPRKKHKLETHLQGERVCYFPDDGKYSLKQMFEREKFTTADDETALYLKMAAGTKSLKTDEDYLIDDIIVNKQARYEPEERQAERHKNRAIKEHRKMDSIMEKCAYCLDSKAMQKHLIVAVGSKVYLSLPSCQSLEEGHCYIVPMTHTCAATHLDEDVWQEVQTFRRAVTEMFRSQEKDVVFLETSLHLRRQLHTFVECIPLSLELGCLAPMYFKKAILESDTEWAQNKKLVDLSKKGIRHSVPKGLPYFSVDFGLQGGFAHVVEDEQLFPDYFGREILGGMLDVEPRVWHKPLKENFKTQSEKVLAFEKWWAPFDCTPK